MNARRFAGFLPGWVSIGGKARRIPCSRGAWQSIAAWLLLALATGLATEEAGRIEGRVANQDGIGISGVDVTIEELGRSTITDPDGHYAFEGVPPGEYELVFRQADLSVTQRVQTFERGGLAETAVDWPHMHLSVTVTAAARHPQRIVEAPAAVTSLGSEEIELQPSHGQLPRLLAFSPGVELTQNGLYDFNFNVRGFNSAINRRVLTLIDGRDPSVPEFLGVQEWAAVSFPIDDLEQVELVRGPTAALYGAGAFNGILSFTTRGARDSQGGKARLTFGGLSTGRVDVRHAGSLGNEWYFKFLGGYSESDDFAVSRNESVEYEPDSIPQELIPLPFDRVKTGYASFRLDKHFSYDTVLDIEIGSGYFEGVTVISPLGRSHAGRVHRPWARMNFISPRWSFHSYYSGRNGDDQRGLSTGASLYSDGYNFGLEFQTSRMFAEGGRIIAGASYHRQGINSANPQGVQGIFARPEQANRGAGFAQVEYDITKNLKGVFSGRLDLSTLHDARFSPRGAVVYSLTPLQTLRLSYSDAFQSPTLVETSVRTAVAPPLDLSALEASLAPALGGVSLGFSNVPRLALGNEDLAVEEINTFEIGYTGVFDRKLFVTLSYYHNQLENFTTGFLPQVGTSLGRLNQRFGPYQPPDELSAEAAAAVMDALRTHLPPHLFAEMSNDVDGSPIFAALSFTNFGKANSDGLEAGASFILNTNWQLDFGSSFFSFGVGEQAPENILSANTPGKQFTGGVSYKGRKLSGFLKYRWVDDFDWAGGIYVGPVPSYSVADLALRYALNDRLTLGVDVANLLNDVHYEIFGGSLLRRRALAYLEVSW